MLFAECDDDVRLYYESEGLGTPIVFVHGFVGNFWNWKPQVHAFSMRHRCITYAARGYPPSDVPDDVEAYSQARTARDIMTVLDACDLESAHLVGLSMGGYAVLHAAMQWPERVRSLVAAGIDHGAEKSYEALYRDTWRKFAALYAEGTSGVESQEMLPVDLHRFHEVLAMHSTEGATNTMRGVHARRPSLFDLEAELALIRVPVLIVADDEDDHCLNPGLFLKKTIATSDLAVLPKCGQTINLEEPELFNRLLSDFLGAVEAGRWSARDPRAGPDQIMRTR